MAEKRRLFIDPERLIGEVYCNGELRLTSGESHYLSRVMRMRSEDSLDVIDGKGHLWNAQLVGDKIIRFTCDYEAPIQEVLREKTLICLAVVIPKKGFEDILQMSCEIGADVIQPLISKRSVVKEVNKKNIRWEKIIRESVEQSERLWSPELKQVLEFSNWVNDLPSDTEKALATTRFEGLQHCMEWLDERPLKVNQVWIAIGPEGGWNKDEEALAFNSGLSGVSMGETILRTSTAAVSACQLMISWRRLKSSL